VTETSKQFQKQLPRNIIFQILSFGTQGIAGIWLIPYLISHLGTAAYGLVLIASVLTQYVNLISDSISAAVNRFYTIALNKHDLTEANSILSTAFFSYIGIGALQVPLFIILIYYANILISIPNELYHDMIVLLICSAGTFIINLIASVFGVVMYANNRIDLLRLIDIIRVISRLVGIVFLFLIFGPALKYVGYSYIATSILIFLLYVFLVKRLQPSLKISVKFFKLNKVNPLLKMGFWVLINQIGALLFLRMDVWVCNRFVDPSAAGEYAALLQWPTLIRQSGITVASVLAPMIMIYFAKSELLNLIRLSQESVRLLSLLIAVPVGIICIASPSILTIWLGKDFNGLAWLLVIMLCHLVVNVGITPLFTVQVALNKIRIPALITLFGGLLNILLAICAAKYLGFGVYGVAMAGALVLTAKNALFTPLYVAKILHRPWHTFLKPIFVAVFCFMILLLVYRWFYLCLAPSSLIQLLIFATLAGGFGIIAVWLVLPNQSRSLLTSMIFKRVKAL